jgi:hypothetical protein
MFTENNLTIGAVGLSWFGVLFGQANAVGDGPFMALLASAISLLALGIRVGGEIYKLKMEARITELKCQSGQCPFPRPDGAARCHLAAAPIPAADARQDPHV